MLNEATKKKIDLLPAANAATEMLKIIPAENLPVQYGGTSEVRHPMTIPFDESFHYLFPCSESAWMVFGAAGKR